LQFLPPDRLISRPQSGSPIPVLLPAPCKIAFSWGKNPLGVSGFGVQQLENRYGPKRAGGRSQQKKENPLCL
jgi:hypothetical protein